MRNAPVEIITEDQDSIDEVGQPIPYPFETPWLADPALVRVLHDILLRLYSSPAERLTLTWEVESDRAIAASLDLSDRVEVMRRGEATEFFVESIRHRITPDFHFITMTLSPAGIYGALFIMGLEPVRGRDTVGMTTIRQTHFYGGGQVWRASYLNDNANDPINDLAGKNGEAGPRGQPRGTEQGRTATTTCSSAHWHHGPAAHAVPRAGLPTAQHHHRGS